MAGIYQGMVALVYCYTSQGYTHSYYYKDTCSFAYHLKSYSSDNHHKIYSFKDSSSEVDHSNSNEAMCTFEGSSCNLQCRLLVGPRFLGHHLLRSRLAILRGLFSGDPLQCLTEGQVQDPQRVVGLSLKSLTVRGPQKIEAIEIVPKCLWFQTVSFILTKTAQFHCQFWKLNSVESH